MESRLTQGTSAQDLITHVLITPHSIEVQQGSVLGLLIFYSCIHDVPLNFPHIQTGACRGLFKKDFSGIPQVNR